MGKSFRVAIIVSIIVIAITSTSIIVSSILISKTSTVDCTVKSCAIVEDECTSGDFKFPCYNVVAKYTFTYKGQTYTFDWEDYEWRSTTFENAGKTCNKILNTGDRCGFNKSNIQKTAGVDHDEYMPGLMIAISGVLFIASATCLIGCSISHFKSKKPVENIETPVVSLE